MSEQTRLRVAALVDLPRSSRAGGHVKCWERLAAAAALDDLPLDLTVFFSGEKATEILSPHVRLKMLPPVFSTARLKFLPYVPDHTDLAPFHPKLAPELADVDVIHTTDGFFAFAKTAEKVARKKKIALTTSFHTDTPSYARIFTRQTIQKLFGDGLLSRFLLQTLKCPERQEQKMLRRLRAHVSCCKEVLATRREDIQLASEILGDERIRMLRLGVDRAAFGPQRRDREGIERDYAIPAGRLIGLFVGRLDTGKNIYTLLDAVEKILRAGVPFHLVAAGLGPAASDIKARLGDHASVPGFVDPHELGRLYASVDLLTLCSEVEIRSMAGVEALASGCPVLVSRKSGIAELFHNTPAMMSVDSGAEAWEKALLRFAEDPALRDAMRVEAAAYGQQHLASWKDVLAFDLLPAWQAAFKETHRS